LIKSWSQGKKCLAGKIFTGGGPKNSYAMVVVVKRGAEMLFKKFFNLMLIE
jgi:hypothetical protein